MNVPPDLDGPPPPEHDFALKKQGSKTPLLIAGVVVAAGVGVFVYRGVQTQKMREMHARVVSEFADIERTETIGKFWSCLFGAGVDPGTFGSNVALSQRLESQLGADPKNYPDKVRQECTPKAIDAKKKIEAMQAPAMYDGALKEYAQSLAGLASAFDDWAKVAPSHQAEREVGAKVATDGAAWHAYGGGKPGADVAAYDRFLHCAVPTVDKMKDGQELVEQLFKQCKDPKFLERLQNECSKLVTTESVAAAAPTSGFKTALKKMQADDRELSAFDDCLRKSRKLKRKDDSDDVGKAFLAYMQAGRKVREVGKEALSEK